MLKEKLLQLQYHTVKEIGTKIYTFNTIPLNVYVTKSHHFAPVMPICP